jgi:shikimate dehydrogenase
MFNSLSGASRLFPIIGDPILYVESPRRLTRTFEEHDYAGVCIPMNVTESDLDVVIAGLTSTSNVDGLLVAMPHKFAAAPYCATSSERSQLLGVVSVMRRNSNRTWHGDMLDGLAFVKAQRDRGAQLEGARALLLGVGGAGRAIALALLDSGVSELVIHDADDERVAAFLELLADRGDQRLTAGQPDPRDFDLVFNATPLGMKEGDPIPFPRELLQASMFVGDVVAGHGETPLIRAARDAGCSTAAGDDMIDALQSLIADFFLDGSIRVA